MIINETENRTEQVLAAAKAMMAAARTAPKGKGIDRLEIITVYGDDLLRLAEEMRRYSEKSGFRFFLRDADNVEQAEAVVLLGTTYGIFNLNCGFCGFPSCAEKEKHPAIPCALNSGDLGIAIGSAASVASDHRMDSRVMYSVGRAALDIGMMGECKAVYGILLSCNGKNPFFDRVSKRPPEAQK